MSTALADRTDGPLPKNEAAATLYSPRTIA
jgi:hypothetical protein